MLPLWRTCHVRLETPGVSGLSPCNGEALTSRRAVLSETWWEWYSYWVYIGITLGYNRVILGLVILGLYRVYIGIMEKKMETTIMGCIGIIGNM